VVAHTETDDVARERELERVRALADWGRLRDQFSWPLRAMASGPIPSHPSFRGHDFEIQVGPTVLGASVWLCLNLGLCAAWLRDLTSQQQTFCVDISSRLFLIAGILEYNLMTGRCDGVTFMELPPKTDAFDLQHDLLTKFCKAWKERGLFVETLQTPCGQNVFCYYRMCSLTIQCVIFVPDG